MLGHPAIVAPLTFTAVYTLLVQQDFFRNVDVGVETMNIVQVDQRFVYHEPIYAGELVLEAFTTLIGQQAEQSVKINGMEPASR